jgi:tetratricopeptide (TPR) repeat protein
VKRAIFALGLLVAAAVALAMLPAMQDGDGWWPWPSHRETTARPPATALESAASARPETQTDMRATIARDARADGDAWDRARRSNTVVSYQAYISAHPKGAYVQQAETGMAALRSNPALYEAAVRKVTEASLQAFLTDYPGHASEAEAQRILDEIRQARDIVDLLQEGKIEVASQGGGITKVLVRLRRLAPQPLAVRIPVGTYFVSSNTAAQNMVTTGDKRVWLVTEEWQSVSIDAACANQPKRIPGGSDTFAVQRSSQQVELTKLMPVLERAKVDYKTRQAAVWIVTDNASYSSLGVLRVSQSGGAGGRRLIKEQEAARAIKICHEAGIDIMTRAIWKDRGRMIAALEAGPFKTWLEEMSVVSDKREQDRAIAHYTKLIESNPKNLSAYNQRAIAYRRRGSFEQAIADYNKAIEIDPGFALAHNNRALVYEAKGEFDRAIAGFTKGIEINPKFAVAYNNRGHAYAAKGELDQAIIDYSKAIEIEPRFALAYNNRGLAYRAKGELDRAIREYDAAIAAEWNYATALNNRAVAYEATGNKDRAIGDFRRALEIDGSQISRDGLKRLGATP